MAEACIIGGGILGATLARALAQAGMSVQVADAGVADRASTGSLAWLNVSSTRDPAYARMRAASLGLWHEIKATHPDCPVDFPGALLCDVMGDLESHAAHLNGIGWQAELWNAERQSQEIPGFRGPKKALFAPGEGYADPRGVTEWMRDQAAALGVRFVTAKAEDIARDAIPTIVTSGNGTKPLMQRLGVDLPLRRSPGILMRTAPMPAAIPMPLATPKLDLWQAADGRIFMSSALAKTPERADDVMVGDALRALAHLFPALAGAKVEEITRRDRPIPEDGFPIVGPAGETGVWLAATHSGMTLAPVIAEMLTDAVLGRVPRHDMSRYQLGRDHGTEAQEAAL